VKRGSLDLQKNRNMKKKYSRETMIISGCICYLSIAALVVFWIGWLINILLRD